MNLDKTPYFGLNVWYAITIAPDDKSQGFGKPSRELKIVNSINEKFICYSQLKIDYILFLELSEPHIGKGYSNGPRLHFHGRIRFRSNAGLKNWLMLQYYDLLKDAIVDIDTIADIGAWDKYCIKQQSIIQRQPIENCMIINDDEYHLPM